MDSDCDRGKHADLVDDPPVFGRTTVNVVSRCPRCGRVVLESSWRKEAWTQRKNPSTTK